MACLVRYSTCSTYSKDPGESGCSVACLVRYSTYSTYSKGPGDCEGSAWCLPRLASLPRLPGIGALPSPRQGRDSSYRGRDSDFALHRGRFSDFALASDFARKILRKRCGGERIASGVGFHPENPITGPAPKVRQRLTECFFTTHTPCRQSWRGHRIATLNPGVGTGLPHSILAWVQDCHTQSWRGHRIAGVSQKTLEAQCCTALRPQTRRPDCAENTGSASVHTDALPDSPPGSLRRIREVKAKE